MGALQVIDNTDDQEPMMVQNLNNDPDLKSRQKMKISFDPFDPQ